MVQHQRPQPKSSVNPQPGPSKQNTVPSARGKKRKKNTPQNKRKKNDSAFSSGQSSDDDVVLDSEDSDKPSFSNIINMKKFEFHKKTTKKISLKTQVPVIPEISSDSDNKSESEDSVIESSLVQTKNNERNDKEEENSTKENEVNKAVKSKISSTTLDKLKRFSCNKSYDSSSSPSSSSPQTNMPSPSLVTSPTTTPSIVNVTPSMEKDSSGPSKKSALSELIKCGRQLSQLSRASSQSSQSPMLSGRHPFLAVDDDDDDLDLSLT